MKSTIMLVGLGDLGGHVLEHLARADWVDRIVVGSRNRDRGVSRCNLARLGAVAQGFNPSISFVPLDLDDPEAVAETVLREAPDLVLSTATMLTWWLPDQLPAEQAAKVKAASFGVWLPVHLMPTLRLMEALRHAGFRGHTLTAPFPDVVNCVLDRIGLAPTCGVGNLDEVVPKLRVLAAERLEVSLAEVEVVLVAHHALERFALWGVKGDPPPFFLRIQHQSQDVTDTVSGEELLFEPYPVPSGPVTHVLTAGSAVRLMQALVSGGSTFLHAPGPNGLPGGYPVLAGKDGVRAAPIDGLSRAQAIAINEQSHPFDGVDTIEPDGTVIFTSEGAEGLRETLGYECKRLPVAEAEDRANELVDRFNEFAQRHGVGGRSRR
jgi:hypothetical protein